MKEDESDTTLTNDIKTKIKHDLNSRCELAASPEVQEILQIASFMDPRFRTHYLSKTQAEDIRERIKEESSIFDHPTSITDSAACAPPPAKKKNLGTLFKEHDKNEENEEMPMLSKEQMMNEELAAYVSLPRIDFEEDPLVWWKHEAKKYPMLSLIARKYLCICATSSPSERLFSSAGNIVTQSRASLKPDKVDMRTFLSKNV